MTTRAVIAIFMLLALQGCGFVGMTAAGAIGTVLGNLASDKIEGKACP